MDGAVRAGGAGLRHRPEPAEPGRVDRRVRSMDAGQLRPPAGTSVFSGAGEQSAAGGADHAAVRPDRLPLRLPDGPAETGHRHHAAGGALLDQFPHPYLRLAHFAHWQRPHQYPADASGVDPAAAEAAEHRGRGVPGHGIRAGALHDPAVLHGGGKAGLFRGGGGPGSGRQPTARLFHRNRASDPVRADGGVRAGVHPLDGAVLPERSAGRQQDHAGGQPDPEPDEEPGSAHGLDPERADAGRDRRGHSAVPPGRRRRRRPGPVLRRENE